MLHGCLTALLLQGGNWIVGIIYGNEHIEEHKGFSVLWSFLLLGWLGAIVATIALLSNQGKILDVAIATLFVIALPILVVLLKKKNEHNDKTTSELSLENSKEVEKVAANELRPRFCKSCGSLLNSNSIYCNSCGTRVREALEKETSPKGQDQPANLWSGLSEISNIPVMQESSQIEETKSSMLNQTETLLLEETRSGTGVQKAIDAPEEKPTENEIANINREKDSSPEEKHRVQFCRFCGARLRQDAPYCNSCGKKTEAVQEIEPADLPSTSTEQGKGDDTPQIAFCRKCGKRIKRGEVRCNNCGAELEQQLSKEEKEESIKEEISVVPDYDELLLNKSDMPPILRRAFLFVEDEEYDRADSYFERVLDQEPECFEAYIGKMLVENKCETVKELKEKAASVNDSNNFKHALQFADEKRKKLLEEMISQ